MHVMHGYHHVDGDIPFKNVAVKPEYYEMVEKWIVKGDAADHFSELARLTLEAAKEHDKVVLSHATDKNEYRDHFIKKLIEGGASEDNIIIVQLTIDPKGRNQKQCACIVACSLRCIFTLHLSQFFLQ